MIRTNMKGVVLTGIGAYFILSKGISAIRGMVRDISDARKWKAYYECKRPNPLAPGYERAYSLDPCRYSQSTDGGTPRGRSKTNTPAETVGRAVGDVVVKMINEVFGIEEGGKKASEGPGKLKKQKYRDILKEYEPETHDAPFIITRQEFWLERNEYDKVTLDWYETENVLLDETNNIISDSAAMLGELNNLDIAFTLAPDADEDPDILFIRNDQMCTDYEIIRRHDMAPFDLEGADVDGDDIAPITPLHVAEEQKDIPATNNEKDE